MRDKDAEIDLHRESDPASLPYSVDEHFHELMLDYFTPYHVIVGEGEGARALLDRLSAGRAGEGRQLIIYADTGEPACRYASKLQTLCVDACVIVPTFVEALLRLQAVLRNTPLQVRLYLAGSASTLQLLHELAERHGIDPKHVQAERCEPFSRRVTCSQCWSQSVYELADAIACQACGTALKITSYYSDSTNSFLALVMPYHRAS